MNATHAALAAKLIAAHGTGAATVAAAEFANLTRTEAMAIQQAVMMGLGRTAPAVKIGANSDGLGMVGAIYDTLCVASGQTLMIPKAQAAGIEVEVALVLKQDLTADLANASDETVAAAVERLFLAFEFIASRFDDRKQAGAFGPLADNMVTGGLVYSAASLTVPPVVDGLPVAVQINGKSVFAGAAKHPMGSVFAPLRVLAGTADIPPIKAGTIITTGSLTHPLIPLTGACDISASFAGDSIHVRVECP